MPEDDQYHEEIAALSELLPEEHVDGERRKHALTRSDLILIARLIKVMRYTTCSMGLTEDEVFIIRKAVRWLNRVLALIGLAVVTAILKMATGIFDKGFWSTVALKLKGV